MKTFSLINGYKSRIYHLLWYYISFETFYCIFLFIMNRILVLNHIQNNRVLPIQNDILTSFNYLAKWKISNSINKSTSESSWKCCVKDPCRRRLKEAKQRSHNTFFRYFPYPCTYITSQVLNISIWCYGQKMFLTVFETPQPIIFVLDFFNFIHSNFIIDY